VATGPLRVRSLSEGWTSGKGDVLAADWQLTTRSAVRFATIAPVAGTIATTPPLRCVRVGSPDDR